MNDGDIFDAFLDRANAMLERQSKAWQRTAITTYMVGYAAGLVTAAVMMYLYGRFR